METDAAELLSALRALCTTPQDEVALRAYLAAAEAGHGDAPFHLANFLDRIRWHDPEKFERFCQRLGEPEWGTYFWRGAAAGHYDECPLSGIPRDRPSVIEPGSDGTECICDTIWPYFLVREDTDDWEPPGIWRGRAQIPASELCAIGSCGHKACHPCWLKGEL